MNQKDLYTRLILGGGFLLLGIGFFLDQFFNINFGNIVSKAWPILIILVGLLVIVKNRQQMLVGGLITLFGVFMLITSIFGTRVQFWDLWPLILIIIGVSILFPKNRNWDKKVSHTETEGGFESFVMFWGEEKSISGNFKDGVGTAIFGSLELDLRDAKFEGTAKLNLTAIFGGIEIKVGRNVKVVNSGVGIFGGFDDSRRGLELNETSPTIEISGTAIFGGVEIKD